MAIILGRLEMPRRFIKDEGSSTDMYAKYIIEPFERGYGNTLGNAMRRVLLSSMEGAAVTSVKVEGVMHEISTIPGVVEDVPEIVMNLKKLKLKMHTREPKSLILKVEKKGEIKAGDITPDSTVEIINPDLHIMTLDKKMKIEMELEVRIGRGYVTSELNKVPGQAIGVIPMDSIFSPVIRVNYAVENTRIGQRTDYDKLILEIWTDGRISPDDALTQCAAILREHLNVFVDFTQNKILFEEKETKSSDEGKIQKLLNTSINEIELSVRSSNCIQRANIKTIGDLIRKSEPEMLKYRNFGKKSLNEIKKVLAEMGLSLGMNVDELLKAEREESVKVGRGSEEPLI